MEVSGSRNMQAAVMRRNGEAYELLGELLGECSACDLHMALSLVSKLRDFGLAAPVSSLVVQPASLLEKKQRQRRQSQIAFGSWHGTCWPCTESKDGENEVTAVPWSSLPRDLLLRIVAFLGNEDRQALACACAAWKTVIGAETRSISFSWAGRREKDRAGVVPLIDSVVSGAAVIFTDLHEVCLRRCELLSSIGLAKLARSSCCNLKVLDLSGCLAVTDAGLIAVAESCQRLEQVQLASCSRLTDCAFVALGSFCSRLLRLNACGCEQLTDLGLKCLSRGARGLRDVNLGWCEALTKEGIEALAINCCDLVSLDLCGCLQVDDRGIAALAARCTGLQSLSLHCCRRLTDASQLSIAANLHGLQRLNISGCRALTPAAVQEVLDQNPGLHTCNGLRRNVIVAGCLNLLSVNCKCPTPRSHLGRW